MSCNNIRSSLISVPAMRGISYRNISFLDYCIRLAILFTLLNKSSLVSCNDANNSATLEHLIKKTSERLAKLKRFALYNPANFRHEKCSTTKFISLSAAAYGKLLNMNTTFLYALF